MADIDFLHEIPKWCSWLAGGISPCDDSRTQAPSILWRCHLPDVVSKVTVPICIKLAEMEREWRASPTEMEGARPRSGQYTSFLLPFHWPELSYRLFFNCKKGNTMSFTCVSRKERKDVWEIKSSSATPAILPLNGFLLDIRLLKERVNKFLVSQ